MKQLQVTYGEKRNPITVTIELPGEPPNAKLTPQMARRAARVATGGEKGVVVMDNTTGCGYRLYSEKRNSHRKIEVQ